MQKYTIIKNEAEGRLEGKLSEFCKTSPFLPVQVGILSPDGEAKIFSTLERVRRDDSSLSHVIYKAEDDSILHLINDL